MTRTRLSLAFLLLILYGHTASGTNHTDAGKSVIESLHATLLEVMSTADELGYPGRVDKLGPALRDTFDFNTIARIVTGKHWKAVSEAQQERFIDVFSQLSAATYASNFDGYSGERFETLSVEEPRGNLLVKSIIVKSDGERVTLDYVLRESDGVWRIVNVIADGVSDLSLKRAEYTAVIKNEDFDSLIARLSDKVTHYGSANR